MILVLVYDWFVVLVVTDMVRITVMVVSRLLVVGGGCSMVDEDHWRVIENW